MIHTAKTTKKKVALTTQVAVIGSGAGGAMLAHALTEKGKDVVLLEQGRFVPSHTFNQREDDMYEALYAGGARTGPKDLSSAILYGRVLGGSTVHYMANSFRLPDWKMEQWRQTGLDWMTEAVVNPYYEKVEALLNVHDATKGEMNRNNLLFKKGLEKLGWQGSPARHARKDCIGAGTCLIGCPFDKKMSQLITTIPAMDRAGVPIFTDTKVDHLVIKGRPARVQGLEATVTDPQTGRARGGVSVKADVVVLAAGGVGSPVFLLRNNYLKDNPHVGQHFQVTPHLFVFGEFEEKVEAAYGMPCSWVTHQFERVTGEEGGYMIQGVFAQPGMVATMLPGFGQSHRRLMALFSRGAALLSLLDDEEPGEVTASPAGSPEISYHLRGKDIPKARDFLKKASRVLLAAGAKKVLLPDVNETTLASESELGKIDRMPLSPGSIPWVGTSCLGTLRMSPNPEDGVVDLNGEVHGMKGLYVSDASWFPGSSAVDPSLTIMANALRVADHLAERLG